MAMLSLLLAAITVATRNVPNQTTAQVALCKEWSARSKSYSDAVTDNLVKYFDTGAFKATLDIPELAKMSGKDLLDFFVHSVQDLPLIVTFDIGNFDNIVNAGHQFNKWQLERAGISFAPNQLKLADYAETTLANFPHMAQLTKPSEEEANTRPIYFAVNLWKKSNGNPMYGNTHFVVYPDRHPMCILAPSDTGWWYKACVLKAPAGDCDCDAYPPGKPGSALGTYHAFHHLILAHQKFYKYPVDKLFRRFYNISKQHVPNGGQDNYYYECEMAGSFWVPEHVWYTILDYGLLWGQSSAIKVLSWHSTKHRPVVWGGDPDRMFLDPKVGIFRGYNVTSAQKSSYDSYWKSAGKNDFTKVYGGLGSTLAFYFLRGNDACGSPQHCGPHCMYMGTNGHQTCLYTGYK